MNVTRIALTDDLSALVSWVTVALVLASWVLLAVEMRREGQRRWWVLISGVLASLAVAGAVFRPVSVRTTSSPFGPRIVALVDGSRRLLLPQDETTRAQRANDVVERLAAHYRDARLSVLSFDEGELRPHDPNRRRTSSASDLAGALSRLKESPGERPQAIVVVSDGRLTRPAAGSSRAALARSKAGLDVPIHTVSLVEQAPSDASIRTVRAAGAAVAHQPLALTVEVGCSPDLACAQVPVVVRELLRGEEPARLASGVVQVEDGLGKAELQITLERAGSRVIEVAIEAPEGDTIPANDTRYLTFSVAKERVRLLHLAGRPTYDVRALRTWLKSDESVDVVAFFILRGETDDPAAGERELALIRFPVDELFTEHLPSFDAVILQDIDAIRYKLSKYLVRLERYVKKGGGLIMVGGPSSFAGGNYSGTPLDTVLPVEQPRQGKPFDSSEFTPEYTEAGRAAPITRKVRSLLNGQLPAMAGSNLLGRARPGAIVLWEHPKLSVGSHAMPVLALGEAGDGRAIALGLDSTHRLAYGELAASVSGRAYGALWDGLLGWLMRDPRYEAARVEVVGECLAGEPVRLRIHRLPGMVGDIKLRVDPLLPHASQAIVRDIEDDHGSMLEVTLDPLDPGGYAARVTVGAAPATRHDFGCEEGGEAFADSRPDPNHLAAIAAANTGRAVRADQVSQLPQPAVTQVTAERHAVPLLPVWVWTALAASVLGLHWISRRHSGLQ